MHLVESKKNCCKKTRKKVCNEQNISATQPKSVCCKICPVLSSLYIIFKALLKDIEQKDINTCAIVILKKRKHRQKKSTYLKCEIDWLEHKLNKLQLSKKESALLNYCIT